MAYQCCDATAQAVVDALKRLPTDRPVMLEISIPSMPIL
jgi:hypothetical protein